MKKLLKLVQTIGIDGILRVTVNNKRWNFPKETRNLGSTLFQSIEELFIPTIHDQSGNTGRTLDICHVGTNDRASKVCRQGQRPSERDTENSTF